MSLEQRTHVAPIADLYPGRSFVTHVTPGHDGPIAVTASVGAEPCDVRAELSSGDGVVRARYAGPLAQLDLRADVVIATPVEPRWTVRLTNTSQTVRGGGDVLVSYPADVVARELVTRERFDELARVALRELKPSLTLDGDELKVTVDERHLDDVPEDWRAFSRRIALAGLPDVEVVRLAPVTKLRLGLVAATDGFPYGAIEAAVTVDDVGVRVLRLPLGGARNATLTVRVGVGLDRQRMSFGPVQVKLAWNPSGLANLAVVRSKIERKLTDELTAQLATRGLGLRKLTAMAEKLFAMVELLDLRITTAGIRARYVAPPATTAPTPTTPAPTPRGRLQRLVVVMMENRSYDHMLRALFAQRPELGVATPYHEDHGGARWQVEESRTSKVIDDPPHSSKAQAMQAAGRWCEAYARAHADKPRTPDRNQPGEVLRYLRRDDIPIYEHLTQHACVCLDWRAAIPGQTWPNRCYSLAGSSDGILDNGHGGFDFYDRLTVCDVLEAQRVPWHYYYSDVPFLELYRRWAGNPVRPDGTRRLGPLSTFFADAAAGTLPRVTWVEPNISDFGSELGSDDHPPADVKHGQYFIRQVYEAMRSYQTRRLADAADARARGDLAAAEVATSDAHDWMLVITYDEHGGFWDSAGPGPVVPDDHADTAKRGFRVPAFLVSPWLPASTCEAALDHASLVRTVLDQFCAPGSSIAELARVAASTGLTDVLDGGVGLGWPSPLPEPRPLPAAPSLPAHFAPPQQGHESAVASEPGATTRLWNDFAAARDALVRAREAPGFAIGGGVLSSGTESSISTATTATTLGPPPLPEPGAIFEGLAIDTDDDTALASVLAATGWRHQGFGADPRSSLLVPPGAVPLVEVWRQVLELRARFPAVDLEPLWEIVGPPVEHRAEDAADGAAMGWALDAINARDAWNLASPTGRHRGAGVVVAHLDTGWTDHHELAGVFDPNLGWDFVDGDPIARDGLQHGPGLFPGHGTATASVLASRAHGRITGAAPEATLIEYRVSRSVVHLSTRRMARAIDAAVAAGAHVISISAGGLWSRALRKAVRKAIAAGVIIVAAAGNYVGVTVWPAAYAGVIALGASTHQDRRWWASSFGSHVALAAPGAGVDCAAAGDDPAAVRRGSGTSYATALTAGALATWLSFHGRDRLLSLYGARGLAAAARRALVATARPPTLAGLGAGILDMHALLRAEPRFDPLSWFGAEAAIVDDDSPRDERDEVERFFRTLGGVLGQPWRDLPGAPR